MNANKETETGSFPDGFYYINLGYLHEVSAGDTEYEKLVTGHFLELLPADLKAMEQAWEAKDVDQVRRVAHNLKTTVSIMGLMTALQPYLHALEHEELTKESFRQNFVVLKNYCSAALKEAEAFYASFG